MGISRTNPKGKTKTDITKRFKRGQTLFSFNQNKNITIKKVMYKKKGNEVNPIIYKL